MLRYFRHCGLFFLLAASAFPQLSPEQKLADFQHLAGLYAKNYAPYEWKIQSQNFDLLDIGPWVARIKATKNDVEFYEVMVAYVASLNDAHDYYTTPSDFIARLNFNCDIFDGKVLVESISRLRLPIAEFPFQVGDEVVSMDGVPIEQSLKDVARYTIMANPRATRRLAAAYLTYRPQWMIPRAAELGDVAVVEIRRSNGAVDTYRIPWTKTGVPFTKVGPVPVLTAAGKARSAAADSAPDYLAPLRALNNCRVPDRMVTNWGVRSPFFQVPDGFTLRLGRSSRDFFYSGSFPAGGFRIGYIRIPDFDPTDTTGALVQFMGEMAWFQQNTDGLVIDVMRNPGGLGSYTNALLQLVMTDRFRTMGFEVRATSYWIASFASALESARSQGAPQYIIDTLAAILNDLRTANREMRGRTGPISVDGAPLDRDPARDSAGRLLSYSKPLMVLADEFSSSAADVFPATIQMNKRGPIFGMRTTGAGGAVGDWTVGAYSEGTTSITMSLMNRGELVSVDGLPPSPYIENVGVVPDIEMDYMTRDNLMNGGRSFVDAFAAAIVDHVRKSR